MTAHCCSSQPCCHHQRVFASIRRYRKFKSWYFRKCQWTSRY